MILLGRLQCKLNKALEFPAIYQASQRVITGLVAETLCHFHLFCHIMKYDHRTRCTSICGPNWRIAAIDVKTRPIASNQLPVAK